MVTVIWTLYLTTHSTPVTQALWTIRWPANQSAVFFIAMEWYIHRESCILLITFVYANGYTVYSIPTAVTLQFTAGFATNSWITQGAPIWWEGVPYDRYGFEAGSYAYLLQESFVIKASRVSQHLVSAVYGQGFNFFSIVLIFKALELAIWKLNSRYLR